jgi:hypothetical protein
MMVQLQPVSTWASTVTPEMLIETQGFRPYPGASTPRISNTSAVTFLSSSGASDSAPAVSWRKAAVSPAEYFSTASRSSVLTLSKSEGEDST